MINCGHILTLSKRLTVLISTLLSTSIIHHFIHLTPCGLNGQVSHQKRFSKPYKQVFLQPYNAGWFSKPYKEMGFQNLTKTACCNLTKLRFFKTLQNVFLQPYKVEVFQNLTKRAFATLQRCWIFRALQNIWWFLIKQKRFKTSGLTPFYVYAVTVLVSRFVVFVLIFIENVVLNHPDDLDDESFDLAFEFIPTFAFILMAMTQFASCLQLYWTVSAKGQEAEEKANHKDSVCENLIDD